MAHAQLAPEASLAAAGSLDGMYTPWGYIYPAGLCSVKSRSDRHGMPCPYKGWIENEKGAAVILASVRLNLNSAIWEAIAATGWGSQRVA